MSTNEEANAWWEKLPPHQRHNAWTLFEAACRLPVGEALEVRRGEKFLLLVGRKRKHEAKKGHWRVYGLRYPMDFEGRPFYPQGKATWKNGWFWIHRGDTIALGVRVHGLASARAICRQLNGEEPRQRLPVT